MRDEGMGTGGTVIACLFAFLIGAATGIITTFTHRQFAPFGVIIGIVVVTALIVGFRLVFESRIITASAALGVVAAIGLLALPTASGSVVIADGVLGYIWVIVPTLIGAVVVAWPRARVRATE